MDAICKIYQHLIDLEEKRQENPLCLQVNQHCFYARFIDGSVNTTTTKTYNYASLFSQEEFEKRQKELMEQLDQLDAGQFINSLNDDAMKSTDVEKKTLNQIVTLRQQWEKLMEINAKDFIRLNEELKKQKLKDAGKALKQPRSNLELAH